MTGRARAGIVFIGAGALVLGALVPWLETSTEREPRRVPFVPGSRAHRGLDHDATASTLAAHEHASGGTRGRVDTPPAGEGTLRVDVVDASGRPASGVPIACGTVSPSDPGVFDARLRARTDATGSAWIELSGLLAPVALPMAGRDDSLRLRAEILADPQPEIGLDPLVPEAHVVLRLPPAGSVRLEVSDEDGRATRAAVRFGVWARAEGASRDVEPLPRWIAAPNGVAYLEHVGLGLELRVAAAPEGDEARTERVVVSGPLLAGEERTISVPLGAEWPTVLVRALDERGEVLRDELLEAEVQWNRPAASPAWSSRRSQPQRVRTDAEGRLRVPLSGSVAGGFTRRLALEHGGETGDGSVLRSAERDLSWDVAAGAEIDLGDVVLRPQELRSDAVVWVSGTVTDPAGSPVPSATVLVTALDLPGTTVRDPGARVTVEADGRFVVTGPQVEQRLSVRAVAPGFLRAEDVVAAGESDLRLRLRPAARWNGRLLLDAGIPPGSLVIDVIQSDRRARTIPASERVTVDGLELGPVDVEVRTRAGDWLVERRELLPTSLGEQPEGRVDELDLRGLLTHLRLRLVEPDGTALDRVFARVHPEPWPEGGSWIRAGRLDLVVPSAARAITVRPHGHPPVAAGMLDGVQELTCGPGRAGGP